MKINAVSKYQAGKIMKKIVLFGPGPLFKGGIANYNTSLAKTFDKFDDVETHIVSWIQQYPSLIPRDFIDRSSRMNQLEGTRIKVHYITDYNKPISWYKTYKLIKSISPEILVFQWAIAIQGIPLGYIAGKLEKHTNIEIIFDMHFVKQKEGSFLDEILTKYGVKPGNTYITHCWQTAEELKEIFPKENFIISEEGNRADLPKNTIIKLYHPIYDMFEPHKNFDVKAEKKELNLKKHVFLFFGFIRKYKGLHNVIKAFAKANQKRDDISLLIVGESFWQTLDNTKFITKIKNAIFGFTKSLFLNKKDNEKDYHPLELIDKYHLRDSVTIINKFVPNEDVHKYFQVSDCIILYYLTATPSGVESISYNFHLPILATKVGHFPDTVKHGFNGYLAEADDIESMAETMLHYINNPLPIENVKKISLHMSWSNYAKAILNRDF